MYIPMGTSAFQVNMHRRASQTYSGPEARRWGAVLPSFSGAVPHHLAVNGTAYTIVQLHIQLRQNIGCVGAEMEETVCYKTISFQRSQRIGGSAYSQLPIFGDGTCNLMLTGQYLQA